MPPRLSADARALLRSQRFVIATWQGGSVQLSPRAMRRAGSDGTWRPVTGRTFFALDAQPDEAARRVAGTLELGRSALLAGLGALVEHGWSGSADGRIDVVVPPGAVHGGRELPDWLRIHRRTSPMKANGVVPMVAPAESVLDASAWARTNREALFIALSSMQQKVAAPDAIADAVKARPRLKRAGMVGRVVGEFRAGATTVGEFDLRDECRRRGLPLPTGQRFRLDAQGRSRYIDAEFVAADGVPVLVEVDGVGHLTAKAWLDDVRRQRRLIVPDGARHLRVTTWELRYEPQEFFADLRRALRCRD